jgi:hypothetical protein
MTQLDAYDKDDLKKLVLQLMNKFPGRPIRFNYEAGYAHASTVKYAVAITLKYREYKPNERYLDTMLSDFKQTQFQHSFPEDDEYVVGLQQDNNGKVPGETISYVDAYIGNYIRKTGACPTG